MTDSQVAVGVYVATNLTKWTKPDGLLTTLGDIARFHKDYRAVYDALEDDEVATRFKEYYGDRF